MKSCLKKYKKSVNKQNILNRRIQRNRNFFIVCIIGTGSYFKIFPRIRNENNQ